ncbi:unnamed protein product, partial [Hapterophycus canaliculatus]
PISAAVRADQYDLVDRLLALDCGPTRLEDRHLHLAVQLKNEAFVVLFLSQGLRPPFGDYLLRLAVNLGNEAIVSLLLRYGAKPDVSPDYERDEGYSTPLLIAATKGHAGIVRLLLDAGASVCRRLSIVQRSRQGLYDFDQEDITVWTESALDLAAIWGHTDVIKVIIERDPSLVDSVAGSTGCTALLYAVKNHQVAAFDALVEAGSNLEACDKDNDTALHIAARSPDNEPILRTLLRRGANKDAEGRENMTPLVVALKFENSVATDILLAAGADVNKSLLAVSGLGNRGTAMIRTLLDHGADANRTPAHDGSTPLHVACEKGLSENVKVLLEAGAEETAVNGEGHTPMDV